MDRKEAVKLLKAHRSGNIKPTEKVKEAIDFILFEPVEDSRVRPLQNRCYILTKGVLCLYCDMKCEHRMYIGGR